MHRCSGPFQNHPSQCSPTILSDPSSRGQVRPPAMYQVQGCGCDPLAGPGRSPHAEVSSRASPAPLPKLNLSSKLFMGGNSTELCQDAEKMVPAASSAMSPRGSHPVWLCMLHLSWPWTQGSAAPQEAIPSLGPGFFPPWAGLGDPILELGVQTGSCPVT